MARKIVHTKRGTYYNGVTGRRKVADPLGAIFKAASSTKKSSGRKSKSSSTWSSSMYSNVDTSNGSWGCGCVIVVVILVLILMVSKCSSGSSHKPKHRDKKKEYEQFMRRITPPKKSSIIAPWGAI
jgi:hypothetical protein